jgi:hypothetical protein
MPAERPVAFQDGLCSMDSSHSAAKTSTRQKHQSCSKMYSNKTVNFTNETMEYLTCHAMISNCDEWNSDGDYLFSLYTKHLWNILKITHANDGQD